MRNPRWLLLAAALLAGVGALLAWQRVPADAAEEAEAGEVVLDGATLFQAKGCSSCHHGPDSTAMMGSNFPNLGNAPTWAEERHSQLSAEEYLAQSIREPWAYMSPEFSPDGGPTTAMPALAVSDAEIDAIVEYLLAE